jgi:hypothetical protein
MGRKPRYTVGSDVVPQLLFAKLLAGLKDALIGTLMNRLLRAARIGFARASSRHRAIAPSLTTSSIRGISRRIFSSVAPGLLGAENLSQDQVALAGTVRDMAVAH